MRSKGVTGSLKVEAVVHADGGRMRRERRHKHRVEMTQGGWEGTVDGDYLARTEPMNEWLQLYVLMMRLKNVPQRYQAPTPRNYD